MKKENEIRVIGLLVEKYVGESVDGFNCSFTYEPAEMERYILMLIDSDNRKIELTLVEEYGECGSGWTTASWGHLEFKYVDHFRPFNYIPKDRPLMLKGVLIEGDKIMNDDEEPVTTESDDEDYWYEADLRSNVFSYSYDGGDGYYPNGGASVKTELFEPLKRTMEKRPVWIFDGESAMGKSTLAAFIDRGSDLKVYETDSSAKLPDVITADIVVVGRKYDFDRREIVKRLFGDPEVIVVGFVRIDGIYGKEVKNE